MCNVEAKLQNIDAKSLRKNVDVQMWTLNTQNFNDFTEASSEENTQLA